METITQSIILGTVQGAAEFLPISSSGHLVLAPYIFGWRDQGLAFDVALHWGTLIAVIGYFWKEWADMIKKSYLINKVLISNFQFLISKQTPNPNFQTISNIQYLKSDPLFIIIIATIPGIVAGLLFNDYAETVFRNPMLIALTLSIGAVLLFYSDKIGVKKLDTSSLTLKKGLIIGFVQALAIMPGLSRSGITITAALLLGLNRTSAAKFSFLLSTPIILGAGIKEFPNLLQNGLGADVIIGASAAAVGGYLAIKYMLKYLENSSYNIFVAYRLILALIILFILCR